MAQQEFVKQDSPVSTPHKVLIISFIYPPIGGSGVQRTLKFSKYLPESGWQPYVVCSDSAEAFGEGQDASLETEIPPEAQVWRRPFVNPLGLRRRVQKLLGWKPQSSLRGAQRRSNLETALQSALAVTPNPSLRESAPGDRSNLSIKRSLKQFFHNFSAPLAPFEFPPIDAALYWALAIVPGCLRLVHREKIDILFTTSFPYSDHLAGYLLKKLTGLPWVADFRDPWTQNASARNTGWRYQVDRWVERRVLHTADRIIGVTPTYTADLHRLAPHRPDSDFVTIENGYDAADFDLPTPSLRGSDLGDRSNLETASHSTLAVTSDPSLRGAQRRGNLTLAHVGQVYDGTAMPFLQALESLGDASAHLQVRFIGGLPPQEQSWLETHPLAAQVQVEPRLPHAEAVKAMKQTDILLLFLGTNPGWHGNYPGKLFEYLASGRPVLLVGPQGDAADLTRRSGTGCAVDAAQANAIVEILKSLVEKPAAFLNQYYRPRSEVIAAYERRALTARLAAVFDSLTQPLSA